MHDMGFDLILKIVILFLIFMAVLALFGQLRIPQFRRFSTSKCPQCGRYRIGKDRCDCPSKGRNT